MIITKLQDEITKIEKQITSLSKKKQELQYYIDLNIKKNIENQNKTQITENQNIMEEAQ